MPVFRSGVLWEAWKPNHAGSSPVRMSPKSRSVMLKDPQASPEAQAELQKLTGQLRVPVLVVGSEKINGFETGQWQSALDRAGYPKSAQPGYKPPPETTPTPAPAQ